MAERVPLVSVVVPNYNYARYLEARMASVLNQTFADFEIILLDDASTDGSAELLRRYAADSRVSHVVVNKTNTGSPFTQWMKGIRLARGKYVWIAEADDLAEPDFLETCVAQAEQHEDVSICYAGSILIDAEGKVEPRDVNHWGNRAQRKVSCFDGKEYAARNLYWKNYIINASGVIFRREYALNLADSDFVHMRYCGDWLFWFGMSMQGQVIEVYRNLNYFRQHAAKATAASRRYGDGVREDIHIVRHMEQELGGLKAYKKRLRRGLLYRKIKRMPLDNKVKTELYSYLFKTLDSSAADYRLERRNQFLRCLYPRLVTAKRDRL